VVGQPPVHARLCGRVGSGVCCRRSLCAAGPCHSLIGSWVAKLTVQLVCSRCSLCGAQFGQGRSRRTRGPSSALCLLVGPDGGGFVIYIIRGRVLVTLPWHRQPLDRTGSSVARGALEPPCNIGPRWGCSSMTTSSRRQAQHAPPLVDAHHVRCVVGAGLLAGS
jgi:hypothetical protein